jgi:DNA-binding response OmpR family regulator
MSIYTIIIYIAELLKIELGAEYYVVKPFDIELLITRIRELKNYKPEPKNNFISRQFYT